MRVHNDRTLPASVPWHPPAAVTSWLVHQIRMDNYKTADSNPSTENTTSYICNNRQLCHSNSCCFLTIKIEF